MLVDLDGSSVRMTVAESTVASKHTDTKHNAVLTKCITKSNDALSVEFRPSCGIRQYYTEMRSPVSPLLICSQLKYINVKY